MAHTSVCAYVMWYCMHTYLTSASDFKIIGRMIGCKLTIGQYAILRNHQSAFVKTIVAVSGYSKHKMCCVPEVHSLKEQPRLINSLYF